MSQPRRTSTSTARANRATRRGCVELLDAPANGAAAAASPGPGPVLMPPRPPAAVAAAEKAPLTARVRLQGGSQRGTVGEVSAN